MLRLYPCAWRRRYGEGFLELVAPQPWSVALVVDVVAGAIDAWISPQVSAAMQASIEKENGKMFAKTLKLGCAVRTADFTPAEQRKSVVVMLTSTLVLTGVWMWIYVQTYGNPYLDVMAFVPLTYTAPYLYTMRYTYLKARSRATQALFIWGLLGFLSVFLFVIGLISARI